MGITLDGSGGLDVEGEIGVSDGSGAIAGRGREGVVSLLVEDTRNDSVLSSDELGGEVVVGPGVGGLSGFGLEVEIHLVADGIGERVVGADDDELVNCQHSGFGVDAFSAGD